MPRIARIVAVDLPHHVTQRGNYRQNIFTTDADRLKYLSLLKFESGRYGLQILAYCLMDNHVHFIAVPKTDRSMGDVFKYVNMKYSRYFNQKMGEVGHLFQGRFFSSVLDEYYLTVCARYIERNPVRAGLVKNAWEWKWSSARAHCGIDQSSGFPLHRLFECVNIEPGQWREFLSGAEDEDEIRRIKSQALTGRPLMRGGNELLLGLERKLNRAITALPKGRPKKSAALGKQGGDK